MKKNFYVVALLSPISIAQSLPVTAPAQPTDKGNPGQFQSIPDSIVSSQQVCRLYGLTRGILFEGPQVFLGRVDKIYILDKVQNNPTQISGHPAWASGM